MEEDNPATATGAAPAPAAAPDTPDTKPTTVSATKSGLLSKKGGIRHNWKDRFCEAKGGSLDYHESNGPELELKGRVLLGQAEIRISSVDTATEGEIEIETPERTWRFRAASEAERDEWLAALQTEAVKAKETGDEAGEPTGRFLQDSGLLTKISNAASKASYKVPDSVTSGFDAALGGIGIQRVVPGEQGTFNPHSEESFICLDVMVGDEDFEGCKKGSLEAELLNNRQTRCPTSSKIAQNFKVTREDKAALRCAYEGEWAPSKMTSTLDGMDDVSLGPSNLFDVLLYSYMPLNAPVGLYKESAKVSSENGRSSKPVVIQPDCRLVDLYMTVDGTPFEDTKFCCGGGNLDNAAAKRNAIEKCYGRCEWGSSSPLLLNTGNPDSEISLPTYHCLPLPLFH